MSGWIKLHRKILDSPVFENEKILKVFMYCLLQASHKDHTHLVGTQVVNLKAGQMVFGRESWSKRLKIKESTLYRYMKLLETLNIVEIKTNNKFSIVTVVNWGVYQDSNNQSEQQMDNKRTTDEQQMDTNKNVKNEKNEKNKDIVAYLNEKTGKDFKFTTKKTQTLINARLKEGFNEDDFKRVIDNKCSEWLKDEKMNQYLRPDTLFGTKFESYLNQNTKTTKVINFSNDNEKFNLWEV